MSCVHGVTCIRTGQRSIQNSLTYFSPMSHFYTSWKRDIDMWHWCKWVKAYTIELFANIISSADLKLLTKFAKVLLQTLIWVQKVLLHMNAMQLLKSIEVISLTIDNDDIILIDYLHSKFGSVNCLNCWGDHQNSYQNYLLRGVLKNTCLEIFLQIIIKTSGRYRVLYMPDRAWK